jgi:hypothetical protein
MRVLLATAAAATMLALAPAVAAAKPRVSAAPNPVRVNDTQTIKGRNWPVIEFCRRRVRLTLKSAQNAVRIGFAHVTTNGRFTRTWTPAARNVGPGQWRIVARMRCESGQDGSAVFQRASVNIRVRP